MEVTRQALLLTDLAMVTLPTVTTDALVHADFVNAGASIAAWVTLTVVDIWGKEKDDKNSAKFRFLFLQKCIFY